MPKKLQIRKFRLCPVCHDEGKPFISDDDMRTHLLESHRARRVWTCDFRSSKNGFFSALGESCKHGLKADSAAAAAEHIRQIHVRPNILEKGFDASIYDHKDDSIFRDGPNGLFAQEWPSLDILKDFVGEAMEYQYGKHDDGRWLIPWDDSWKDVFFSLPTRRQKEQMPETPRVQETAAKSESTNEYSSMYIVRTISEDRSGDNSAVSASILAALGEREKPSRIYDPGARLESVSLAYLGGR